MHNSDDEFVAARQGLY